MRIKKISITGVFVNPSTPMSDQDRISLYNINTITGRQAMRIKKISFRWLLVDPVPNSQN